MGVSGELLAKALTCNFIDADDFHPQSNNKSGYCSTRSPNGTDEANYEGENFAMISGTSMAAPHIAGIATLIKQKLPHWSPVKRAELRLSRHFENKGTDRVAWDRNPVLFCLSYYRLNTIRLEEKEIKEKELRSQIIQKGEEYIRAFHEERLKNIETNKLTNREGEKMYLAKQETFHKEADKPYWKAIAELIPREVPNIEKRGKKDEDKKPSITVIQGPKPGKPTDLSRLRHILVKLKHTPPAHMIPPPPTHHLPPPKTEKRKVAKMIKQLPKMTQHLSGTTLRHRKEG
ncbi:hypothetical protein M8C21_033351 [Ambrosia artemisiifolia]|uniref:Peptidase S8/S53 domain-containing protein n=1 Tax=Ambrosia artemisiifolia TaxID=4212 RepID=A0AAD5DBJ2_AMBAR|nr:hypothetical protein M8C21_033351 [Ambrosia artemisiifolia]